MKTNLPWSICFSCGYAWYLPGDGCLHCGQENKGDVAGSVTGEGTYLFITGPVPSAKNKPESFADVDMISVPKICYTEGFTFVEVDGILRLELGESHTVRFQNQLEWTFTTWVKIANINDYPGLEVTSL